MKRSVCTYISFLSFSLLLSTQFNYSIAQDHVPTYSNHINVEETTLSELINSSSDGHVEVSNMKRVVETDASGVVSVGYWYPEIKGDILGWDGVGGAGNHQYYVADCFCLYMGHGNYMNIALNGTATSGSFVTFDHWGDLEYLNQSYYGYIKITCSDS